MRKKADDMSNNKVSKDRKLTGYIRAPMRFLIKARDLYVESMRQFTTNLTYCDAAMGYPNAAGAPPMATLPRSFSVGSTRSITYYVDHDSRKLVRGNSVGSYGNRIDWPATVPRSHSVNVKRIDEDRPCDFGNDIRVNTVMLPRSRSYALRKRTFML
ncbi:hypothetical protein L6164_019803 [Bauhinia variegata]|uniref:Uncharacterized protein n=1 Tax=Bauhinia variegata TaxID=167791 RepID=A0ACB9MTB4_BAUVA|nr:hypothetical protein L6164_019803 [Bauhinia variegata]